MIKTLIKTLPPLAVLVLLVWAPAQGAGDANSAADANQPVRQMRLDAFLAKFSDTVSDYKAAGTPAKKAEVLEKAKKAVRAEANAVELTLSGKVQSTAVRKDGTVAVTLAAVDEITKLRDKPIGAVFWSGSTDWAEGGLLVLKMTAQQAAGIKKGDSWSVRGRPVTSPKDDADPGHGFLIQVHMSLLAVIGLHTSEQVVDICQLVFPKFTCTIAGAEYESAGLH